MGVLSWLGLGKKEKGYPFHVYDRSGRYVETVHARVKVDQDNNERKYFIFDKYKDKLLVREPTKWIDGQAFREATFGISGELVYLNQQNVKIAKDDTGKDVEFIDKFHYLERAMLPEERQITAGKIKENTIRYAQPMNKWQAIGFLFMVILVITIVGGTVYNTIAEGKISNNYVEAVKESSQMGAELRETSKATRESVEALVRVAAALTNDKNLTTQLK